MTGATRKVAWRLRLKDGSVVRWYQLVSASMLPSHGHIKLGAMAGARLLSAGS